MIDISKYTRNTNGVRGHLWRAALQSKTNTPTKLDRLRRYQWLDTVEIRAIQEKQLRKLIRHANENVPFYRKSFDASRIVSDDGTVNLNRFGSLPILEKSSLRKRAEELRSRDIEQRNWYENSSGGSTGEPVAFIQDQTYDDWSRALTMLFAEWTGYEVGEPKVLLWGSERDLFEGEEGPVTRVKRWLKNEHWLNAFRMETEDMRGYVNEINELEPTHILAYADSLYEFAEFIDREGLNVHSPDAIMTSAGTLHPHMRDSIESVFSAKVFNRYGSREMGDMACECDQHNGFHVCPATHYVEIVDESGTPVDDGEMGEIVVTSLTNYSMPLIRYRIGDVAIKTERRCSCGRAWPLIDEVSGRVTDMFVREDGSVVSSTYFIHLLGVVINADWIEKYRIVQNDYDHVTVLLVTSTEEGNPQERYEETLEEIREKIKTTMGEQCTVEFEFKDNIEPTDSGKYRYTISRVHED